MPALQSKEIISNISSDILIGDMNSFSLFNIIKSKSLRIIEKKMRRHSLNSYTWPTVNEPPFSYYPKLEIDHCFYNKDVSTIECDVLKWKGSDHFPLRVKILNNS